MSVWCPLDVTRITSSLYQGSLPPPGSSVARCGFTVLVLTAAEYQPPRSQFPGVHVIYAPLHDQPIDRTTWQRALVTAYKVAEEIRHGEKVLVTCNAGLNRSGLIVALTLHLISGQPGAPIVGHVQRARPGALSNRSFVRAIREFAG